MNNNQKIEYLVSVSVPKSQIQSHERMMNRFLTSTINRSSQMKLTEYLSCKKVINENI